MVNQGLSFLLLALFLLAPPVMLTFRLWKQRPSWWMIGLGLPFISWLCMNGVVTLEFSGVAQQVEALEASGKEVPEELMESFANDGAPRVFALFFGWLYIAPFFLFWMLPFGIIQTIRHFRKKSANQ